MANLESPNIDVLDCGRNVECLEGSYAGTSNLFDSTDIKSAVVINFFGGYFAGFLSTKNVSPSNSDFFFK